MLHDSDLVSVQEVRTKVEKAYAAWLNLRTFSQEQLDAIVEKMAEAGRANAERLAQMAVEETGMGNVPDKIWKNLLNADLLPRTMRGMKLVGILREIPEKKVVEIGEPMGVVAAILPTTNPTSTAIFKVLIALKAGNTVVISPHPRAKRCTCETAGLLYEAARSAGAPEDVIQCIEHATMEGTTELMRHRRTGVILATGGSGMVRAAYSSGKPAFGVGPGNVPVLIDTSADVKDAVAKVVAGKAFDYGTVCSSEQSIVAEESIKPQILAELKANKAYIATADQTKALARLLITPAFGINPKCVGQSPQKIAEMAGFTVPAETTIIAVEIQGVGKEHPLSMEKLSPVLSLLFLKHFDAAMATCEAILRFGGLGHTCVIFAKDERHIRQFGLLMPAFRILVNTSAPQGSTGITTNVFPSMTLGCGAVAGNITSDNVGPQHLVNIKRIAYVARTVDEAFPSLPASLKTQSAPRAAAAVAAGSGGPIDRGAVLAAVEHYLAQRGVSVATSGTSSVPGVSLSSTMSSTVATIVDRFLASKRGAALPAPNASCNTCAGSCNCPVKAQTAAGDTASTAEPAVARVPAPPPVTIVDFVCEDDVREAVRQNRKIYIGPRSIVTPSARDLAGRYDTLVVAERASGSGQGG